MAGLSTDRVFSSKKKCSADPDATVTDQIPCAKFPLLLPTKVGLNRWLMVKVTRTKAWHFSFPFMCFCAALIGGMVPLYGQEVPANVRAAVDPAISRMRPNIGRD